MHFTRVTHFAPCPPPVGGVSTFVRRLHERLLVEGIESRVAVAANWSGSPAPGVYRRGGLPWRFAHLDGLLHLAMPGNTGIVHWHDPYLGSASNIWALRSRGRDLVITVHSPLHCSPPARFLPWQRYCARKLTADRGIQWVAVSVEVEQLLVKAGVAGPITVLPAYLPDLESGSAIPQPMAEFIGHHTPLLLVYAHQFLSADGRDLYGCEEAILLLKRLIPRWPHAGLLVVCSLPNQSGGHRRLHELIDLSTREGVKARCFWQLGALPSMSSLLSKCSLYLRPTLTDGDSVLLREALAAGCKVIASDAVSRPDGAHTYALHDRRDMDRVVNEVLSTPPGNAHAQVDTFAAMLRVYSAAARCCTGEEAVRRA